MSTRDLRDATVFIMTLVFIACMTMAAVWHAPVLVLLSLGVLLVAMLATCE